MKAVKKYKDPEPPKDPNPQTKLTRLERKIARKQKRLDKMTPGSNKNILDRMTPVEKPAVSFNMNNSNDGVKGSCEEGNLKVCQSEAAETKAFSSNKSRFNLNTVGDPQKRKKMQENIDKLKEKQRRKYRKKNPLGYANPRFL